MSQLGFFFGFGAGLVKRLCMSMNVYMMLTRMFVIYLSVSNFISLTKEGFPADRLVGSRSDALVWFGMVLITPSFI